MRKTRKKPARYVAFLLLAAVLLLGGYLFVANFVWINGRPLFIHQKTVSFQNQMLPEFEKMAEFTDLKELDLRGAGMTPEDYNTIRKLLPDCRILWDIRFQGKDYNPEETEMEVTSLTTEEAEILAGFPALSKVDARSCPDYEALSLLAQRKPDCRILCRVELSGETFSQDIKELKVRDAQCEQLQILLPLLPDLEKISLTGDLPELEKIQNLESGFPEVRFCWQHTIEGAAVDSTVTSLAVEDPQKISVEDLKWLPQLEILTFKQNPPEEKLRAEIREAFPELEVVYNYQIGLMWYPSDVEELDLSGQEDLTLQEVELAMNQLPNLKKVILCDCGFAYEDLDALNRKYEQIRVVWNVKFAERYVRTDETYFYPYKWKIHVTDKNIGPLKYCTDMVCIDLGHNALITHCEWASEMKNLTYLVLADTQVKDLSPLAGNDSLKFLELFQTPGQDLSPLTQCRGLEDLNLCYTKADPEPLKQITWLKRLWWSGYEPAEEALQDQLPNTLKDFHTFSSTGDGWREGHLYFEMRDIMDMFYLVG